MLVAESTDTIVHSDKVIKEANATVVTPEPQSRATQSNNAADSTTTTVSSKSKDVELLPMPDIPKDILSKEFEITGYNVEVTSLDITNHGCFVLVGCSNGMILLFDMANSSRSPAGGKLVGHIKAKGLHTSLLLTVKITEDCRFCFAGVTKGSSEMLAIDLAKLSVPWVTEEKEELDVDVHSHSDAKLRGFSAVAKVIRKEQKNDIYNPCYRLACGKGIKNVHIWEFKKNLCSTSDKPSWTCIYDVASNGNTITCIGFRNHGMVSQSANLLHIIPP